MEVFREIQRSGDLDGPLPGSAYRLASVFEAEASKLFPHTWISVACGQNVPAPRDVFPVRIAGRSLLVLRDADEDVRVFYNMCRHRGAPLADAPCSARSGRITCPYHAWSFGLDGALEAAPHLHRDTGPGRPSETERSELGLLAVRSAVWRDVVFVNLSGDAVPFADFIRPLDERIARYTPTELRALSSDEYEVRANWKLAAENFLDAYHLPIVHPQLPGGFSGALACEDLDVGGDVVGFAMPEGYGAESGQERWTLPRFPDLGEEDRFRIEVFCLFPNTLILVEPDIQQVIVLRPQAPDVTHETFANYMVGDAAKAERFARDRDEMHRDSVEINDQDVALLERLQATRSMDVAGETRPSPAWDVACQRFQRLWARRLDRA
jgi:phenylpropionate dioxygenase-like ring-hydroxylating dioxygenase large terminal subunit